MMEKENYNQINQPIPQSPKDIKILGKQVRLKIIILISALVISGLAIAGYFYWQGQEPVVDSEEQEILMEGEEWFQTGNTQSMTQLQPKQSHELENSRIMNGAGPMLGLEDEPDPNVQKQDVDQFIDIQINLVVKRVRLSIDWFDWCEVEETGVYSKNYIDPNYDRAITGLADKGIKITYVLVFWDEAIQADENYYRFKTEDEIQRYLDYVQFIVSHFKGRIEYYEILNEPNAGLGIHREPVGTQQDVEVDDYINLVRRVVPVIRQADPEAKVVVGAVTPFLCSTEDGVRLDPFTREYLFSILESDVMPLVDAVSWHALGGTSPGYVEEYYYGYPAIVEDIKDVASAHGFEGEYIGDELHWRSPETPHLHEYDEYSKTVAVKYLARGIVMHLGMNCYAGIAEDLSRPLKRSVVQNLATIMAGAEPTELPLNIESEATNIKSYTFSLSNGDTLVALWTDGAAVDDDPGVNATVTIPNFSAQEGMGIDVLKGYQQSLVITQKEEDLVIEDLIVRDYPMIIRIVK